jgi:hypothetical protein
VRRRSSNSRSRQPFGSSYGSERLLAVGTSHQVALDSRWAGCPRSRRAQSPHRGSPPDFEGELILGWDAPGPVGRFCTNRERGGELARPGRLRLSRCWGRGNGGEVQALQPSVERLNRRGVIGRCVSASEKSTVLSRVQALRSAPPCGGCGSLDRLRSVLRSRCRRRGGGNSPLRSARARHALGHVASVATSGRPHPDWSAST